MRRPRSSSSAVACRLRTAIATGDVSLGHLWIIFMSLGGTEDEVGLEAYLHGLGTLGEMDLAVLAYICNQELGL